MSETPKEGIDFYFNEEGLMVMTEAYHLERGYCCENDCKHCAYKEESEEDNQASLD